MKQISWIMLWSSGTIFSSGERFACNEAYSVLFELARWDLLHYEFWLLH